jgi:hypothetical protein
MEIIDFVRAGGERGLVTPRDMTPDLASGEA